jgi:hypothetical protein
MKLIMAKMQASDASPTTMHGDAHNSYIRYSDDMIPRIGKDSGETECSG